MKSRTERARARTERIGWRQAGSTASGPATRRGGPRTLWSGCLALWVLTGPAASPQAAAPLATSPACRPWQDEPAPLPAVWSPDPIAARWARERADALADQASAAEARSLAIALRLWERVLCLDPENIAAANALERPERLPGPMSAAAWLPEAPAVSPDLPAVSAAPPGAERLASPETPTDPAASPLSSAWPFMVEILPPYVPPPPTALAENSLSDVDQELSEIRQLNEEAHFRTALSVAAATRGLLERSGEGPAVDVRRARLGVLSATAAVALGRDAEARSHMADALSHDPSLSLDAGSTSPKVLALLREVRASDASARTAEFDRVPERGP